MKNKLKFLGLLILYSSVRQLQQCLDQKLQDSDEEAYQTKLSVMSFLLKILHSDN